MEQGLCKVKLEFPSQNNHKNTENSKRPMNVPGKASQKVEEVTMAPDIGKERSPQFKNIFTTAQKLKRKGKIHSDLLQEETESLLLHRPGTKSKNITWVHGWGKCICMCSQGNMDFRMTDHNPGPAGVGGRQYTFPKQTKF